ncbi:hypothetical protein [Chryseobacterium sp. PMSZPI]|uniref:hypothetical protein n=1 Tax=Chryseobacterium sp. PMSZPI TaxID=1033900 RepID=UPI000C34744B|nr:hypothetical protein [Chryseobacterium sp. PMSZPI]PKF75024.1 hypothetical protein CW752_06330 [Chryseobacterium sp. PMSZPI]
MQKFKMIFTCLIGLYFFNIKAQITTCDQLYQEGKQYYERKQALIKKTNFSGLLKDLYHHEDFKNFTAKDKNIILNILIKTSQKAVCGNVPNHECKRFEKTDYPEIFEQLWNKENYLDFVEMNKDKIIIPAANSNFIYDTSAFKKSIKWNTETGKEILENGSTRNFYYNTKLKLKKELTVDKHSDFNILGIAILPWEMKDKENCYLVQLQFNDTKPDAKYSKSMIYQYENKSWQFLEYYN